MSRALPWIVGAAAASRALPWIVVLWTSAAGADTGALILQGRVEAPLGLEVVSARRLLARLGWAESPTPDPTPSEVLGRVRHATRTYWSGEVEAAKTELATVWRQVEGKRLAGLDRESVLAGLWLLAQHYAETDRPTLARRVCRETLRLAPSARPRIGHFSGVLRNLYADVAANYRRGRQLIRVTGPAACRVLVDGVDQGAAGARVGPLDAGTVAIALRCGASISAAVTVTLTADAEPLAIRRLELRVMRDELGLRAPDAPTARALERALLEVGVPWVVTVREAAGAVGLRVVRPGAAPIEPRPVRAGDVAATAREALDRRLGLSPTPSSISTAGWALAGSGLGLALIGGVLNGYHAAAVADTNTGQRNRIDESRIYLGTALGLYVTGAVLTTVGLLLREPTSSARTPR